MGKRAVYKISKQQKYDMILREEEHKTRKPVDNWFLNGCREQRMREEKHAEEKANGNMAKSNNG